MTWLAHGIVFAAAFAFIGAGGLRWLLSFLEVYWPHVLALSLASGFLGFAMAVGHMAGAMRGRR